MNEETREQYQNIADEHKVKIYVYELQSGDRFSALAEPLTIGYRVMGSQVKKLLEVIKPQKKEKKG